MWILLGSIIFIASGIWFLYAIDNSAFDRAVSIGGVIIGGLGAPISALAFLPRAAFLRLDGAGFEYADCFFKRQFAWRDVKDFRVWLVWSGSYSDIRRVGFKALWRSRFIAQALPDTYGFTADETVALMESWQNLVIPSLSGKQVKSGKQMDGGEQRFVAQAERLGRNFAHVSTMQWIGMAVIGLSFVAAVVDFLANAHAPQLSAPADPILSDHGPERVTCDAKWSALPQPRPRSYREFLQNCMEGNSGSR